MSRARVVVIGLDGLEPRIVESMVRAGELPALARLQARGGYSRLATTTPAQTPVAWSTFATGVNPGAHGIFDFLRRDPRTYRPDLALSAYEQSSAWLPPRAVNLRRGTAVWEHLGAAGIGATILRCPCTYPPDTIRGRLLAGVGVPDLRGGLGTATYYTTAPHVAAGEGERVLVLERAGERTYRSQVIGPRNPPPRPDLQVAFTLELGADGATATLASDGDPRALALRAGEWSDWLRVRFKHGIFQSVRGAVRFLLVRSEPAPELYASPVNFDPAAPLFPISSPASYAAELAQAIGTYHTTGMVEDTGGVVNGRFDESAFLAQCALAMRERERMMDLELDRFTDGLFFCLFDTPDRLGHVMWRFREPDHPANAALRHRDSPGAHAAYARAIEDCYRGCDAIVGRVLDRVGPDALVLVLSDHGMGSFRRGLNTNAWLHAAGLLALTPGHAPGEESGGEFFPHVDWEHTRAYALGLGGIYLNRRGREARGTVDDADARALADDLARGVVALVDPATGEHPVRAAHLREHLYRGPFVDRAPDLVLDFAAGYRVSWTTGLGGIPADTFEDNTRAWSGDHLVDPALVPGVLFSSRPLDGGAPSIADLAPTILRALGAPAAAEHEGRTLLP